MLAHCPIFSSMNLRFSSVSLATLGMSAMDFCPCRLDSLFVSFSDTEAVKKRSLNKSFSVMSWLIPFVIGFGVVYRQQRNCIHD